jgi:hypothetical protein
VRRCRFGRIATVVAAAYLVAVLALAVTGDISPAWYSLALAASALLLLFGYAAPPAERPRRHVLVATLACAGMLCLLPAADQEHGPITTCNPQELARLNLDRAARIPGAVAVEQDSQRVCDAAPHHEPLIRPAKATRVKEPQPAARATTASACTTRGSGGRARRWAPSAC